MTFVQVTVLYILLIAINVTAARLGGPLAAYNHFGIGLLTGLWLALFTDRLSKRNSAPIREVPAHGGHLITDHFRGELADGQKFLYCPVGNLVSWHPGDHDHRWCHWCQKGFEVFNRKDNQ